MIKNKWVRIGAIGVLSTSMLAACGDEEVPADAEPEEVLEAEEEADALEEETDTAEENADELEEETDTDEEQADELEEETDEAAEEVLDDIDYGNIDPVELDEGYLTPLDWTVVEFDDYVFDTYGERVADFDDYADLEATVGPYGDIVVVE